MRALLLPISVNNGGHWISFAAQQDSSTEQPLLSKLDMEPSTEISARIRRLGRLVTAGNKAGYRICPVY
ncbi:hypothetical protein PG984_011141 [Apiospora sp. TS-2023a]